MVSLYRSFGYRTNYTVKIHWSKNECIHHRYIAKNVLHSSSTEIWQIQNTQFINCLRLVSQLHSVSHPWHLLSIFFHLTLWNSPSWETDSQLFKKFLRLSWSSNHKHQPLYYVCPSHLLHACYMPRPSYSS